MGSTVRRDHTTNIEDGVGFVTPYRVIVLSAANKRHLRLPSIRDEGYLSGIASLAAHIAGLDRHKKALLWLPLMP
jgi:hypothetical protein